MKKFKFIFLLAALLCLMTACGVKPRASKIEKPKVAKVDFSKKYTLHVIPTLFFHGAMSNYKSERNIVKMAQTVGITNSIVRADVRPDGQVKFSKPIPKNAVNPIIEVNYKNNIQLDFEKAGLYATNVVKALKQQYGITEVNMVAHSLGNMSVMYYLLENSDKSMPRLNKQVAIAGHFDGVDLSQAPSDLKVPDNLVLSKNGKPNKMNPAYKQMLALRKIYPQENTKVLNIVGDKSNQSDGLVTNASSESLKYLLGTDRNYQLRKFYGKSADHGRLTYNRKVIGEIIAFLWN